MDNGEDYLEDFCDHMDADLDILTGILRCDCGYRKWLTSAEYKSRVDFEREAAEALEAYIAETISQPD